MDILTLVNESKKRTLLINGISIDWQYAQQLLPKILSENNSYTPEFFKSIDDLTILFDNIEKGIKELKILIPSNKSLD